MGGVEVQRHTPVALPPGKTRYSLYRRLGGGAEPFWTGAENVSTRIRSQTIQSQPSLLMKSLCWRRDTSVASLPTAYSRTHRRIVDSHQQMATLSRLAASQLPYLVWVQRLKFWVRLTVQPVLQVTPSYTRQQYNTIQYITQSLVTNN